MRGPTCVRAQACVADCDAQTMSCCGRATARSGCYWACAFREHEQQTAGVLQGLSDTLGAARAGDARQGDAGESRAPPTPLVLERGAIALDDYESGAEVLYKAWCVPMPAACLDVDA